MRALICDPGAGRSALAGCRALAQEGWSVSIASPVRTVASLSRWAVSTHRIPAAGEPEFPRAVARLGRFDVVLPAGDAEAVSLSAARDEVAACLPYPRHSTVVRAFDKVEAALAAQEAGLRVPEAGPAARLPVVVKARTHAAGRSAAHVARTTSEMANAIAQLERQGREAVVQELIDGYLFSVALVADANHAIAAFAGQQALGVWPLGRGVSTRAITVPVDDATCSAVAQFVATLGWIGMAQMQFLVPADGVPRFIDFNGRLYGSLSLAEAAGARLTCSWADLALGTVTAAQPAALTGRRYQWLEGDLRRALAERRGGIARDVASTLAYAVGARHGVLDIRDPMPAVAQGLVMARRAATKVFGRASG